MNSKTKSTMPETCGGFESVIVFGFKDGKVLISASDIEDNLRLIGALEAAKQQVWANA